MKRITIDVDDDFDATADQIVEMFASAQIGRVFGAQIDEVMFVNHYRHADCPRQPGIQWDDVWSCMCNDRCPACNAEITPYESTEVQSG